MFENNHPVQFLALFLNTSVFGSPTQTQFTVSSSILSKQSSLLSVFLESGWRSAFVRNLIENNSITQRGGNI